MEQKNNSINISLAQTVSETVMLQIPQVFPSAIHPKPF